MLKKNCISFAFLTTSLMLLVFAGDCGATDKVDVFLPGNFFSVASQTPSLVRAPVDPVMADDLPTLDQVRLIPSLKGDQNKQVSAMFELYRSEIKPLQVELKAARTALNDAKKVKKPEAMDSTDVTIEQLSKAESLVAQSIKDRRFKLLTELKGIVSESQLAELQKIRRGELIEQ